MNDQHDLELILRSHFPIITIETHEAPLHADQVIDELRRTKPLSIVMAEKISALRNWAQQRTVPAD